jgi:hypothetical protein
MEINWNPSRRQLRTFGLMSLLALPLATALWTRGSLPAIGYAATIGGALAVVGLVWPRGLRPILVAINVITWPLVLVVRDLVLVVAFYGVIVPVGLVCRLFGRDALQLKIDRHAASYWQEKQQPANVRSYFRRW